MYKVLKITTGRYPPYILPRLPLCCHAMWKFENSECSIFKMKDVTGLKTFTKMYCSVHFNLVYSSEVSKTPLRQIDDDRSRLLETPNHSPGIFHRKWGGGGGGAPPPRPSYTPYALKGWKDRALRPHKTLTLRFTDFFTYFEENPNRLAV